MWQDWEAASWPKKSKEEDRDDRQEVIVSLAAAKEISVEGAVALFLELDGIFILLTTN